MKRFLIACYFLTLTALPSWAGSLMIENKSDQKIKISAIGGAGYVDAKSQKEISFETEENEATLNIWWVKNARQLCQIFTPWDRTVIVSGKQEIHCLSRK